MKLTAEEQCMLDMMEITGFPIEIKHGLYTWDLDVLAETTGGFFVYSGRSDSSTRATADFSKVVKVFTKWKEERTQ